MVDINRRFVIILLLLILILAAFFRFWNLGSMPPGLYHDEAYNGLDALSLLQGNTFPQFYEGWELYAADAHGESPPAETRFPIFFEGNYGREPLHVYLMALSIYLLGASPLAVRAVPAMAGTLAVLTTFLATYIWLGSQAAKASRAIISLLAAFTLAILYPAVHFSRFGIRAMVFVLVETLTIAFFWWGINRLDADDQKNRIGTWIIFLTSGFFLGLGLYTFAAARLMPLVWIFFVPLWYLLDRTIIRKKGPYIIGMAVMSLITALPILWFFLRYPYYFFFRIAFVSNKGKGAVEGKPWLTWLYNVGRVVRGLVWRGETHLRHNLPGRPYLDVFQVFFFLIGIFRSLRRLKNPRYLFLLVWLIIMLLPSIMSGDAPHFGRLSGAAAPISILIGLGGYWLIDRVKTLFIRRYSAKISFILGSILILVMFFLSAIWTAKDYFVVYAQHPDLSHDFYEADWLMGQYAASQPAETSLYLTPTQEELATIYFALADPDRLQNYSGEDGLLAAGIPGRPSLYLVRPEDQASMRSLESYYPEGTSEMGGDGYVSFFAPGGLPQKYGFQVVDESFADKIQLISYLVEDEGDHLLITLGWQAQEIIDEDYTVFIHLMTPDGQLLSQVDRQPAGYPTSEWQQEEVIVDRFILSKNAEFAQGDPYIINTGFYFLPTLERLGESFTFPIE